MRRQRRDMRTQGPRENGISDAPKGHAKWLGSRSRYWNLGRLRIVRAANPRAGRFDVRFATRCRHRSFGRVVGHSEARDRLFQPVHDRRGEFEIGNV